MNPQPKPEPREKKSPKPLKRTALKRPAKPVKKVSKKGLKRITKNQKFYDDFIKNHPTGCCEETGDKIENPTGSNVSHIIPSSNIALYYNPLNAFLLRFDMHQKWHSKEAPTMKIWAESQRRKEILNNLYYGSKILYKAKGNPKSNELTEGDS